MSIRYNDDWLEAAKENFEQAVANEDWAFARAVIGDLKENGFSKQTITLEEALSEMRGL